MLTERVGLVVPVASTTSRAKSRARQGVDTTPAMVERATTILQRPCGYKRLLHSGGGSSFPVNNSHRINGHPLPVSQVGAMPWRYTLTALYPHRCPAYIQLQRQPDAQVLPVGCRTECVV